MNITQENKALKSLLKNDVFYINWYSTDCDGIQAQGSHSFKTLEDFNSWETDFYECAEGAVGFNLTDVNALWDNHTTSGGWDIN